MDAEEDTSSTSSGPSVSEKSNSAKRAECESPEGMVSPEQSTGKTKPDRSNGDEPPYKIQKHDHTFSVVSKDPEASSESLKEEVPASESPNTEDETPMEVDEQSPLPSELKSEEACKSPTSSESLKEKDPTSCEPVQDPVTTDKDDKPESPSPSLEVSCLSETSDITLKTTESIVMDEDKTLNVSSSLTSEVLNKPLQSQKQPKKQDAMDEEENPTLRLPPDVSGQPEAPSKSLSTQDPMEEEKLSPSIQSDISSEPKQSDEDLKKQNQSSSTLNGQGPCENVGNEELATDEEKLTTASSCQPDVSSEPGPSGEHLKTLESDILCEPGPSGEHLRNLDSPMEGIELSLSSFNLDEGVIGNQSLDRATCEDIQAELDPRIDSNQILSTFYRLRDSYVRQRRKQSDDTRRRERSGKFDYVEIEILENKDEISIRSWLKYALPREAEYLNSIAGAEDGDSVADPPSLEDDRSYSLSSDSIPEEDRLRWKRGIALGERILRIGTLVEKCTPNDTRSRPNRDYNFESQMTNDLMNLLNDLARKISDTPEDPQAPENRPPPPLDDPTADSGNVSPNSLSFRFLPSTKEDNTSLGGVSLRSEEEPVLGAVGGQSPRPRHDQVSRVLSQVSLDSESSDSLTYYPKDGDTSSYKLQSSILDCPSIQDESDSTSLSAVENPKDDLVSSDLAEVHLDNDESESACSLEVQLDQNESPSDLAEPESESTAYPTSSETSSDQNCSYTAGKRKKEEDSEDGWC